jgi:hypothetical protein
MHAGMHGEVHGQVRRAAAVAKGPVPVRGGAPELRRPPEVEAQPNVRDGERQGGPQEFLLAPARHAKVPFTLEQLRLFCSKTG